MPGLLARLGLVLGLASCGPGEPVTSSDTSTAATTGTTTSGDLPTAATTAPDPATTTTTATTTAAACEDYTARLEFPLIKAAVTLVLDRSPAMQDPWDHDQDPQTPDRPRWHSVRAALLPTLSMQPLDLGLAPYPTADAEDVEGPPACRLTPSMLVAPGDAPPAEVLAALPPANPPPGTFVGGAPLRDALVAALAQLPAAGDRPRALLVLANSAANCDPEAVSPLETYDAAVLDAAVAAFAVNVPVFVLGIGAAQTPSPALADHRPDGVVVSDELADLAAIGGGAYTNVDSEAALVAELTAQFEHEGASCWFEVAPVPGPDQAVTAVTIAGQDVPQVSDCAADDGWHLVDADTLELCGLACTKFQQTAQLEISVSCT